MRALVVALVVFITAATTAPAQDGITVPRKPKGYVTDRPKVLSKTVRTELETKLATFGKDTGNQVVVWIGSTLPADVTIEEYANASFNLWGIGSKETNNGVLLMLFIKSRKMRIETGDGIRDRLPDAKAAEIIEAMKTPLRAGDYDRAITEATNSIMAALTPPVVSVREQIEERRTARNAAPVAGTSSSSDSGAMACATSGFTSLLCLGVVIWIVRGLFRAISSAPGITFGSSGISSSVHHYHHRPWGGWGSSRPRETVVHHHHGGGGFFGGGSRSSGSSSSGSSSSSGGSGGSYSGGGSSSGGGASGSW
ncbi:MAG TPA: TPM domain-containing protein [Thermoanaerobaculia bacterium]